MPNKLKYSQLRIIGGQWRGRKIKFPVLTDVRPTADRVRETLFNWLSPYISGAVCLDLFAGSGALGLEALSRGAKSVVMVDNSKLVVDNLQTYRQMLALTDQQLTINQQTAEQFLMENSSYSFDIIFLDPPFKYFQQINVITAYIDLLINHRWVKANGLIYLEMPASIGSITPILENNFTLLKAKSAGQVKYMLMIYK